jgi:outer membrane protein
MARFSGIASRGLAGALALAATTPAARAESLADALSLAYQTNPTLQGDRAQLRALNETYVQARAGLRPQASLSVEADFLQSQSTREDLTGHPLPTGTGAASLNVSQPLFTGGQVSAQVRATMGDILSGRQKLRQTEANVLQAVVQAYVDVRRDTAALGIAQDNVAVLRKQLDETKARFDVGEITRTDVAQAEARLAGAQAQLSAAQAQLGISRAGYAAQVGQNPGDLAQEPPLPNLPTTLDAASDAANSDNPGVLAADFAERAAAARVSLAKAGYRPTLSLRASAGYDGYIANQPGVFPSQVAGDYTRAITASAVLTQPLFTGGLNSSEIRQALENDNAQRIALDGARRAALQSVTQAWNQLLAARATVTSSQEQVRANEVAYQGAKEEAEVGLRTTLDVLNAEQELESSRLALVNAQHDQYVAGAGVLGAMGQLEARNLIPATPIYDPQTSFRKVRNAWAMPWDGVLEALDSLGGAHDRQRPAGPAPAAPAAAPVTAPPPAEPIPPAQAGGKVITEP